MGGQAVAGRWPRRPSIFLAGRGRQWPAVRKKWNFGRGRGRPYETFMILAVAVAGRQMHKFMAATATKNKWKYDEFVSKIVHFLEKISLFLDKFWESDSTTILSS